MLYLPDMNLKKVVISNYGSSLIHHCRTRGGHKRAYDNTDVLHLKTSFVFRVRGLGQLQYSGADEARIHFLKDTSAEWMLANTEFNPGTSCLP